MCTRLGADRCEAHSRSPLGLRCKPFSVLLASCASRCVCVAPRLLFLVSSTDPPTDPHSKTGAYGREVPVFLSRLSPFSDFSVSSPPAFAPLCFSPLRLLLSDSAFVPSGQESSFSLPLSLPVHDCVGVPTHSETHKHNEIHGAACSGVLRGSVCLCLARTFSVKRLQCVYDHQAV